MSINEVKQLFTKALESINAGMKEFKRLADNDSQSHPFRLKNGFFDPTINKTFLGCGTDVILHIGRFAEERTSTRRLA